MTPLWFQRKGKTHGLPVPGPSTTKHGPGWVGGGSVFVFAIVPELTLTPSIDFYINIRIKLHFSG